MKAEMVDLQTLFGKPVSYRIPQFQRPYAWKKGEQWVPLWDDVRNLADGWLRRQQNAKLRPHFMGAIVLQRQNNASSEVEKRIVVDGQQRLTTLQLLIRAAQEVFAGLDDSERSLACGVSLPTKKSIAPGTATTRPKSASPILAIKALFKK